MKVELSKHEVELLDAALDAWEKEPHADAMLGGFIGSVLAGMAGAGDEQRISLRAERDKMRSDSISATQKRRLKAALLRAKLLQALAIDSEHSVEENAATPPQAQHK